MCSRAAEPLQFLITDFDSRKRVYVISDIQANYPGLSTSVAQARGDAVDRDVYAVLHQLVDRLVVAPRAVAPHELDLQVVERIDVREAVLDRARQRRVR